MTENNNDSLLFNLTTEPKRQRSEKSGNKNDVAKLVDKPTVAGIEKRTFSKAKRKEKLDEFPNKKGEQPRNFKRKSDGLHYSSLFTSNPSSVPLIVKRQKSIKQEPLFTNKTFDDLKLHPHLVSCLKSRLSVVNVTTVQRETIPVLLQGQDALVKSCTGSGKTLAYAIPIVQNLQMKLPKISRSDGVYALIIVPTRELALQCFESFSTLTKAFTWIVPGYLIGGEKKKSEKSRLRKGINILISTPGRLLDHLDSTACLSLDRITWLVIDEADKLLEQGFEEAITKVISKCSQDRQSALLSATLSRGVKSLAGMSLSNPVNIDISMGEEKNEEDCQDLAVPDNLKQYIVVVPPKLRLVILSGFIVKHCLKGGFKGLVFMCSQNSVDFHHNLLTEVLTPHLANKGCKCKFFKLHGNMKQEDRTEVFSSFRSAKEGVLLCTDVAARGLDMPSVDWIVQHSAPCSPEIYVHRVGRTARIGKAGSSLLFLLPSENKFSHLLADHKIEFEEVPAEQFLQPLFMIADLLDVRGKGTAENCASALQTQFENEVYGDKALHQSAKDAYSSYMQSYASYSKNIRHVLPFHEIHLGHLAKSFCLREAPSNLRNPIPQNRQQPQHQQRKNIEIKQVKRKIREVSEFGSGLSEMNFDFGKKTKRKKKH